VLLATVWCAAGAGLPAAEMGALLEEANTYFRQANEVAGTDPAGASNLYRKAVMRYERIARDGPVENGKLYYNIGNAYFRMKDLGRAVLNYRRAERYIPNDPNLQQNLAYARTRRLDRIEEPQRSRILRTLFFWHYDLSTGVRSWAFTVFYLLLWCAATVRLWVRRAGPSWVAALAGLLATVCLVSLVAETVQRRTAEPGVILAEQVVARKGNSTTYEPSFREPLHAGTEFERLEDRGAWYHVALADGRRCWLPATSVGMVGVSP
jgi:hypothetical protein